MFDPIDLTGATGGTLALAYAAGCVSGYGFAIRTAYRAIKQRLDKVEQDRRDDEMRCERKIIELQTRQRELEDMLLGRRPLGVWSEPSRGPIEQEAEAG